MKIKSMLAAGLIGVASSNALYAAVSAEEAARLGADLTPVGAETAGNKDGSIPAWDGKGVAAPAGWKAGEEYTNPYPDDKPIYQVTSDNMGPQQEPRFNVVYMLYCMPHNARISLRVPLNGNAPSLPTIETLYPNANWHEREIWDMFGIRFTGHSDMRRILNPYDWEGHPLRKDYPLGYEEPQFTFNFEKIQARKLSPKE